MLGVAASVKLVLGMWRERVSDTGITLLAYRWSILLDSAHRTPYGLDIAASVTWDMAGWVALAVAGSVTLVLGMIRWMSVWMFGCCCDIWMLL